MAEAPWVILVNEAFVRRYFPGEDPIGKSVRFWRAERQIVGVVGDVRFNGLNQPAGRRCIRRSSDADERPHRRRAHRRRSDVGRGAGA